MSKRKKTVIEDDLNIKGGGIYCILFWEKLDSEGKAIFKIGYTTSFRQRMEQYHGLFVLGVYLVAFLKAPTAGRIRRAKNGRYIKSLNEYYREIETKLKEHIEDNGGIPIHSTTRVRNANEANQGETEFFYMNEETIRQSFEDIRRVYGGTYGGDFNDIYDINDINKNAAKTKRKYHCSTQKSRTKKAKSCYVAEIYYPL